MMTYDPEFVADCKATWENVELHEGLDRGQDWVGAWLKDEAETPVDWAVIAEHLVAGQYAALRVDAEHYMRAANLYARWLSQRLHQFPDEFHWRL